MMSILMRQPNFILSAIVAAAAALAGCKSKPMASTNSSPSLPKIVAPVAIVDLQRVDKAMGWDLNIQQAMAVADQECRLVLSHRLTELAKESEDFRASIAKEAHLNPEQADRLQHASEPKQLDQLPLTGKEKQQLVAEALQIAFKLADAQQNYRQELSQDQDGVMTSYTNVVKPAAQRVAERDGFHIVKIEGSEVLYCDPAVDVSQQVIGELTKGKPSWERPAATQE